MKTVAQAAGPVFQGYGKRYARDLIERGLREVARRLKADHIIVTELPSFSRRYALALTLEGAALSVKRFVAPSSLEIGKYIHQTLQQVYLRHYQRPPFSGQEIVIERTLYRDALPPRTLAASFEGGIVRGHVDYLILDQALLSPFTKTGPLRTDLTHLTPARQIWEIKPVTQASNGVIQETYYRVMYNILAHEYASNIPPKSVLRVRTPYIISGGDWPADTLRNIPLTTQMNAPGFALPFWVSELPGLVLYVIVKGLTEREFSIIVTSLTAALLATLKRLTEEAKKLGNRIAEALARFGEELARAARMLLEQIGHWLVIVACVIAAIVLFLTAPTWAPVLASLFALGAPVLLFVTSRDETRDEASGDERARRERATLNFGFVSMGNFPVERLPQFALLANSLFEDSLQTASVALSEALRETPQA